MRTIGWIAIGTTLLLMGCGPRGNERNVELIQDMMESPALKPQEAHEGSAHNRAMRVPPDGTAPKGFSSYKYAADPIGAGRDLTNPYQGESVTEDVLLRGKRHFEVLCMVCHGATGAGDGPIAGKMALKPPSLLTAKVNEFPDGRIYHIIRVGQGVMGSYGPQVGNEDDIWAIVNYVRLLQQKK